MCPACIASAGQQHLLCRPQLSGGVAALVLAKVRRTPASVSPVSSQERLLKRY